MLTLYCALYLLFAGTIAPLLAMVYTPKYITPSGGVCSLLGGVLLRVILEGALPKDGSLVLPFGLYNYNYGTGTLKLSSNLASSSAHAIQASNQCS